MRWVWAPAMFSIPFSSSPVSPAHGVDAAGACGEEA